MEKPKEETKPVPATEPDKSVEPVQPTPIDKKEARPHR